MKRFALTLLVLTVAHPAWGEVTVPLESTYTFEFNTVQPSTGAPFTMGGTPAIEVYENANDTPITAGDTFSEDDHSVTGLHSVALVCSAANGYEAGKWYTAVIAGTTPTVDSVSVAGRQVARFRVVAAETIAGVPKIDLLGWLGVEQTLQPAESADLVTDLVEAINTWWMELDYWTTSPNGDISHEHSATDPTPGTDPTPN
jgi:hypothetical protein